MTNRKRMIFIVFSLLVLGVFVSLGQWQLRRLDEKETMLAQLRKSVATTNPAPVTSDPSLCDPYYPVFVTGMLDQTKPIFRPGAINPYAADDPKQRLGYNLFLPLINPQTHYAILVDFGWVDAGMRQLIINNAQLGRVQAMAQSVAGWALPGQQKTRFIPENDVKSNTWYWQDWPALQSYTGYDFAPCILYNELNWFGSKRPSLADTIPNNHRQYAWTWFGLALAQIMALVYYIWSSRNNGNSRLP